MGIFLLANNSIEIVLEILFLSFSNMDIQFGAEKLILGSYIATKALLTTRQIELINKYKLANIALDENSKTFIMHISTLEVL